MSDLPRLQLYLIDHGIRHFTAREIAPVGKLANGVGPALVLPPEARWPNIVTTLLVMEELRAAIGAPIHVNSCWRSPSYNRAIGGARFSLHVAFNALDFIPALDLPGDEELDLCYEYLDTHPDSSKFGIGRYRTFIHFDTRGFLHRKAPARWDER